MGGGELSFALGTSCAGVVVGAAADARANLHTSGAMLLAGHGPGRRNHPVGAPWMRHAHISLHSHALQHLADGLLEGNVRHEQLVRQRLVGQRRRVVLKES